MSRIRATATFTVYGETLDQLDLEAEKHLTALGTGREWDWNLDVRENVQTYQGEVVSWEATVTAQVVPPPISDRRKLAAEDPNEVPRPDHLR